MTQEEKAKAYDEALEKAKKLYEKGTITESLNYVFPELKYNDDRIRKALITYFQRFPYPYGGIESAGTNAKEAIAWLEKQESVEEIVARCKKSWYNEGKIQGMKEGLTDDEKYQQGWHDALEKQGSVDKDKAVKGVRRGVATSLINYIDANSKGMCLSNMECEDIEDAIVNGKWYKVYNYMKKKLEKQGDKPQGKTALEAWKEKKADNSNKVESAWNNGYCNGYIQAIEKAVEWLENHNDYIDVKDGNVTYFDMGKCVEDFRKAMEGGEE